MKLKRPYIPVRIRLQVIARQLQMSGRLIAVLVADAAFGSAEQKLSFLLLQMFGNVKLHLDHDPPLCLREIIDAERGLYNPEANDPLYLIYRTEEEHRIKTFVRGDGAQFSDAAKRRRALKQQRRLLLVISDQRRPSRWPKKGSRPLRSSPWKTR